MNNVLKISILILLVFTLVSCADKEPITIYFHTNGGQIIDDLIIDLDEISLPLTTPIKDGYTFDGWFSDENLTIPFSVPENDDLKEISVYAKWLYNYTISFNSNGGSNIQAIRLPANHTVIEPSEPTKSGYTFDQWYSDVNLTVPYEFTVMEASNITLYAKWNIKQITLTFETNGGNPMSAITKDYMTPLIAPTQSIKAGHHFEGWYSDPTLTNIFTFNTMPAEDMILYAKWSINQYTISFETNGGNSVSDIVQDYMSTVIVPDPPIKTGYHFDGWMTDEALTIPYAFSTMPINGITLYAKWTISSYTLIYESNGGSSIDEITQEYMTPINAPTPPTKDGFVFGGWYDDASYTSLFIFTTMPSSDMTIYAKWDPILYTINFINPMDDSEAASPIDLPEGADINLSSPYDLEGYTFDSWYLDEALTIAFNIDNMPDYDFTVYGKWDLMSYTVTFETNSGTIFVDQVVYYKDLVPNPGIPVKEGYLFAGWYYNELLTFPYEFIDMPATDITIYAKWVEKGEFYPIDLLMINQPNESVVVQGVIYFTFLDPLDGYYVYDGTGYIFIDHSNEGLTVGDGIKVTGTFVMNNHITQLENITNLTSDGAFITLPSVTEMSMLYLSETSSLELDTYGKPIMITGSVSWDGSNYFLNDIELGNVILINSMSYASISNPFESIIGQTITIKVIIHDYNDTETYWDVIHDSTAGIDMHS